MTGRELFKKYNKIIYTIVKIAKIFPYKFRKKRFDAARMLNGKRGQLCRYVWLKTLAKSVGDNVVIFPCVFFEHLDKLEIGNNVSIHQMCYIDAAGGVVIGDNVSIAHRSTVLSSNHSYSDKKTPIKYQDMILKRTVIKNDVWIGCGVTILAGNSIGNGVVIGANSVVTHDIDDGSVVVGNPSKVIKNRL